MNINTKIDVANSVISSLIAKNVRKGFDPAGDVIQTLVKERSMLYMLDEETLDKVILKYGKLIKEN